jgi:hypothetical protein
MVLRVKPIFGKSASWFYDLVRTESYVSAHQFSPTGPQAWYQKTPGSQKTYCRDHFPHVGCRERKRQPTSGFHLPYSIR